MTLQNSLFSVVHQNIRSMRANFNNFICHLDSLEVLPSLIFLTEIWINDYELDNYYINNFSSFGKCNNRHRAGGTCVFFSDKLQCRIKPLETIKTADGVIVYCRIGKQEFCIVCLYRLHAYHVDEFLEELKDLLDNEHSKNLCLLGDLNIDILSDSREANDYMLIMASHGLQSHVTEPTRIVSNSCIDHLFVRQNIFHKIPFVVKVHDFDINDHASINVEFNAQLQRMDDDNPDVIWRIDYSALNLSLANESWTAVYDSVDVNDSYDKFLELILSHIYANRYLKKLYKKQFLKPWITLKIKKLIELKNNLYKKSIKNPANSVLKKRYSDLKKKVKVVTKQAMDEYFTQKFNLHAGNSKKQWEIINSVVGESSTKKNIFALKMNLV